MRVRTLLPFLPCALAVGCGDGDTSMTPDTTGQDGSVQDVGSQDGGAQDSPAPDGSLPDTSVQEGSTQDVTGDALVQEVGPDASLEPDPVKVCANYLACANSSTWSDGMGDCLDKLNVLSHIDWTRYTFFITFLAGRDIPDEYAVYQARTCVASATDCDQVLACINGGTAVAQCTPPKNYSSGRHCADTKTQKTCATGIETAVDCTAFGQQCRETAMTSTITLASCSQPGTGSGPPMHITCEGSLATINYVGSTFTFDCALFGSTCRAGEYMDFLDLTFCVGSSFTSCTGEEPPSCNGTKLIDCVMEHVSSFDCATREMACLGGACVFPGCSPGTQEGCNNGVITFCGPSGTTQLNCSDLGFAGCKADGSQAWCTR
jgi:hypothetical protein